VSQINGVEKHGLFDRDGDEVVRRSNSFRDPQLLGAPTP
jgi:hypothetical protein